ncbi:MAG: hypothetical protein NT178_12605 [Proteobacteria bacterium]|nr:hypothetical protein [Pseudomonadota bacterium]
MGFNRDIYDFAAKAGSLEGYVFPKEMETSYLAAWIGHIVDGYNMLPEEVRREFQDLCNGTIGRTIQSLITVLGENHELIIKLKSIFTGELPSSPYEFDRKNVISHEGKDIPAP